MRRSALAILSLMLAGRAMTLAFLTRVGGEGAGDPPLAWLMPLAGDGVIGLSAVAVAVIAWKGRGLLAWTIVVVWNCIGIWDALSAFAIHLTVPWPTFFMVEIFGASMFFAAIAMHLVCLALVSNAQTRRGFGLAGAAVGGTLGLAET